MNYNTYMKGFHAYAANDNYVTQLQSFERTVWGNVISTAPTTRLQMLLLGTLINVYIMNFERIMTYPFWLGACAVHFNNILILQ